MRKSSNRFNACYFSKQGKFFSETLRKRFDGKLSESMVGPHCDIFGQVFSAFTGRKINKPSTSYVPDSDEVGIRCSFKAQEGLLFLLERSFFYLPKPPMFIRHEEIASVEFLRVGVSATGQSSKTFDVIFNHRNNDTHFLFTGIFRDDYKPIVDYFQAKNIAILNLQEIVRICFCFPWPRFRFLIFDHRCLNLLRLRLHDQAV